jgi:transcription elongation factor GreA
LPSYRFSGIIALNHNKPPQAVLQGQFGGFVLTLADFAPFYLDTETTMATLPITKRGAEILKAELHKLKTVERPSVIAAISEARAQGDLSENAEYDAAKDRQGFIEGRILEVEGKLSVAQVIDPKELNAGGKIVFGTTVDLEAEDTGAKVTYQIVGEDEADIKYGLVNISSPIARALIGKEEGDTAEVQAPGGVKSYEIISVRYI